LLNEAHKRLKQRQDKCALARALAQFRKDGISTKAGLKATGEGGRGRKDEVTRGFLSMVAAELLLSGSTVTVDEDQLANRFIKVFDDPDVESQVASLNMTFTMNYIIIKPTGELKVGFTGSVNRKKAYATAGQYVECWICLGDGVETEEGVAPDLHWKRSFKRNGWGAEGPGDEWVHPKYALDAFQLYLDSLKHVAEDLSSDPVIVQVIAKLEREREDRRLCKILRQAHADRHPLFPELKKLLDSINGD
jgi:hypothetical protein